MSVTFAEAVKSARLCKKSVENNQTLKVTPKWGYYYAQAILNPRKNITSISFEKPPKSHGDSISNQIKKADYIDCAKRIVAFTKKNKVMPNFVKWNNKKISAKDYTYNFAKIIVWYTDHQNTLPAQNNINTKVWIKPHEYYQQIYDYFAKKTGKKFKTLDDLLAYVRDNFTYEFYSDDWRSNKEVMDDFAGNCTDLMQWLANMAQAMGYDWKCIHVECRVSGIGHVWGKFRHKTYTENTWINRDPSAVCGNSVRSMWCEDGYFLAENPSWWMANLNR